MESYSVGERVYLRFRVESTRNEKFDIGVSGELAPYFTLSVNGKKQVTDGTVYVSGDELRLWFAPTTPGTNVLDIWYTVCSRIEGRNPDTTEYLADGAYEKRTVRFLLQVVR